MISENEYKSRRTRLAKKIDSHSIVIIHSANHKTRSNDTEYPYRQDSNFYYLTGFKEDESCLMIVKKKKKFKTILFVLKKDETKELWSGKRLGKEEAKKQFLVDEVDTFDTLEERFNEFAQKKQVLYFDFKLTYLKFKALKRFSKGINIHKNIAEDIQMMRLIKSDAEVALIKKAIEITQEKSAS